MKGRKLIPVVFGMLLISALSCENVDNGQEEGKKDTVVIGLDQIASIIASIQLQEEQLQEVHDAVSSSSTNGYDEEYTMKQLFENPGSGVGEVASKSSRTYSAPLRDLICNHVS